MATNTPETDPTNGTGLGWPKRPQVSRLLGWPFGSRARRAAVSRETNVQGGESSGGESSAESNSEATEVRYSEPAADHTGATEPGEIARPQGGDAEVRNADQTATATDAAVPIHATTEDVDDPSTREDSPESPDGESSVPRRAAALPEGVPTDSPISSTGSGEQPASPERDFELPTARHSSGARDEQPPDGAEPTPNGNDGNGAETVSRGTRLKIGPMPPPASTRVFVVANQKGGVGKTTSTVNIAAALALGGLSVLVVDLDPQGNASTALGVDHQQGTPGTYEVLIDGKDIADYLVDSPEAPNLKVLPATVDLAGAEIELVSVVARENKLKRALKTYLDEHPTDYVLLDCPPSLGLLTLNALVAAREVLIPIQCEYYALEGVSQLMNTIDLVMGELNESLQLSTVLLTMYDARTRLAAQVAAEVRAYFAEQTLPTIIPRSVRISEAPSYGQTVLSYHPDSAGAVSYLQAAQEIARRGAKENA
jgi:chromosome partitioning protein